MDSSECYVVYGLYDTLDTFLSYGFPDINAPYVRSIPMEIQIACYGALNIRSLIGARNEHELPKQITDLRRYMPLPAKQPNGDLDISHLMIPIHAAPHSKAFIASFDQIFSRAGG